MSRLDRLRRSAAWLWGDLAADSRFHTGPIGPANPTLTGIEPTASRRSGMVQEDAVFTGSIGLDHRDPRVTARPDPIADPGVQRFPDVTGPTAGPHLTTGPTVLTKTPGLPPGPTGLAQRQSQAQTAIIRLDPDTRAILTEMMRSGLMSPDDVLAMMAPDGSPAPTAVIAAERLMQGMARLIQERLHLTAADTFQPPVGQTDRQGSRWQAQQLAAIAHTVLQGVRDGMAGDWSNLHFRLEVPQMPDGSMLLDRDIGAMRYGHFDQGPAGTPPTMVLSALDANPQASAAVQGAWRGLWNEISTGQHYLGNGNPTANTMATMLQGYLQEQQIDWIAQTQRPVVRALELHVEKTAKAEGPDRDFALQLLTSSSGLRSDAIANLWALHQLVNLATSAQGSKDGDAALLRLRDYLGTVGRSGPQADQIRRYLGPELLRLDPGQTVDDWLATPDGRSQRQVERVTVTDGDSLPRLLKRAGGGSGPEAVLEFVRLNQDLKGGQALHVTVDGELAKKLRLTGKTVNGTVSYTYAASEFVRVIEADRKMLDDLQCRFHLQQGPGADPGRTLTITKDEARRIGYFDPKGYPITTIAAQRLWELVQLARSRSDDAVRSANVMLRTGATVELPPRTWHFSANPGRQMALDNVDARSQMLAFVSRHMQADLLATPRVNKTLAKSIQALQTVDAPLQEDGRFGNQTKAAMARLEQESGMHKTFDPTTWYRHMLRTAMPTVSDKQHFWVALTTHEMIGHGTEARLIRAYAAPVADTLGSADEAYAQTFQFWGYGVFGFLNGHGEPPRPGEEDALTNDPRTVAAHATIGTESLADGLYTFNPDAGFITPYAKSSPAEAWAESMRFFTQRPELLLRESPAAFLFINAVTGRYDARQLMTMAAKPAVFASETAARQRLDQAITQLCTVRHPSINPAVVRQFEAHPTITALQGLIRPTADKAPSEAEFLVETPQTLTVTPSGDILAGPEQKALQQLLDDPKTAAAWAAAVRPLQPTSDDPGQTGQAALASQGRRELVAAGVSPINADAIPDRTLLRWMAEADDMVTLAYVRQAVAPDSRRSTLDAGPTLTTLRQGLWRMDGTSPEEAFPAGVWQRTSLDLQQRLTDVVFLTDLQGKAPPAAHGLYAMIMHEPGEVIAEIGQVRLAERKAGFDRLQNQVQTVMWDIADQSLDGTQGAARIAALLPQIRADLSEPSSLTTAYQTFLDQLARSLHYYAADGTNPPPTGYMELYGATTAGISATLAQISVLREQLHLTTAPSGPPN